MVEQDSRAFASAIAGTTLIILLTLPAVIGIISHLRAPKSKSNIKVYADKDGTATPESMAKYSAKCPKTLLVIFAVLGLFTSIALAVLGTLGPRTPMFLGDWLNTSQWVGARDSYIKGSLLTYIVAHPHPSNWRPDDTRYCQNL